MATDSIDAAMGFAPDHDSPVPYMERTRNYYKAIGYDPYRWAHFIDVPFTPFTKTLSSFTKSGARSVIILRFV